MTQNKLHVKHILKSSENSRSTEEYTLGREDNFIELMCLCNDSKVFDAVDGTIDPTSLKELSKYFFEFILFSILNQS